MALDTVVRIGGNLQAGPGSAASGMRRHLTPDRILQDQGKQRRSWLHDPPVKRACEVPC